MLDGARSGVPSGLLLGLEMDSRPTKWCRGLMVNHITASEECDLGMVMVNADHSVPFGLEVFKNPVGKDRETC